jgi:hypothetical protein
VGDIEAAGKCFKKAELSCMRFDPRDIIYADLLSGLARGAKAEFACPQCEGVFFRSKREIHAARAKNVKTFFCSLACCAQVKNTSVDIPCGNCGLTIKRKLSASNDCKTSVMICSHSCSASYNNKNKSHGTRRSKLEVFLYEKLTSDYPDLAIEPNGKLAVGSELDLFFPGLKLAIEINGIFHYEPIYGLDKLTQIQKNDALKFAACREAGIELCIINTSKCDYLTAEKKDTYYKIVKELLDGATSLRAG